MKFIDSASTGKVQFNEHGYLITRAKSMRTGVQVYTRDEMGLMGGGYVRVYRPEASVKDAASLQSMSHAPVTLGHPSEEVTSDNWKDLAVGEVSTSATWDGDFISLPLIIKDQAAIDAIKNGTAELSAGYIADMEAVEHPDYDFIMSPPKYNHLAIVDKARAGHEARIGDSATKWGAAPQPDQKGTHTVDMIKVKVGDKAVNVAVDDADVIMALMADHAKEIEARDAAIGEHMATIENLKAEKITDADIEQMVAERATVTAKAAKMIDGFKADGKSVEQIKREALTTVYDADKVEGFPVAAVDAMFDVLEVPQRKPDPVKAALGDAKPKKKDDPWAGKIKSKGEK